MMSNKKTSEVWNHFEETSVSNVVRCNYCLQNVTASRGSTGNLIRHMSAKHPSVALRRQPSRKGTIVRPVLSFRSRNNQESDAELEGEDNELISEIVYLEDGNDENEKKYTTAIDHDHDQISDTYKRRKRHRDDDAPPEKYRLPKVGRNSVSSEDDRPVLLVAAGKKDNEEADAFSKYLMQLLKSLPKHIQTKLQMEIVNVVMKAKMEYEAKQQEREDEEKNAASSAKDSRYSVMVARNEPLRRILSRKSETDTKKNSNMLGGTTETEIGIATEDDAMTSEVNLPTTYLHSL
ncbi:hypothetical protein EVAR_88041_1 [Eumeta japonica]|uniref:BED-type domain-containing protein n=1 Tax=Eumeta variegata TaxID=151549 RepID=A0A4C1VC84_EUMVA|nr:hypothetical protein EVAR_88041_1 [Eumeta japonica]